MCNLQFTVSICHCRSVTTWYVFTNGKQAHWNLNTVMGYHIIAQSPTNIRLHWVAANIQLWKITAAIVIKINIFTANMNGHSHAIASLNSLNMKLLKSLGLQFLLLFIWWSHTYVTNCSGLVNYHHLTNQQWYFAINAAKNVFERSCCKM